MLTLMLLLGWMVVGYVTFFIALIVHMVKAESIGYDAFGWWTQYPPDRVIENIKDVFKFIWGLLIWPVRLVQFLQDIPKYYEQYGLK